MKATERRACKLIAHLMEYPSGYAFPQLRDVLHVSDREIQRTIRIARKILSTDTRNLIVQRINGRYVYRISKDPQELLYYIHTLIRGLRRRLDDGLAR